MTTEATIQAHRRYFATKIIKRLASVGLTAIEGTEEGQYTMYGASMDSNSGAILSTGGSPIWTTALLLDLLAKIETYGIPTPHYIKIRNEYIIRGGVYQVPAGRLPMDFAGDLAYSINGDVVECWAKIESQKEANNV